MIIFGTSGITYSKGQANFHCPQCGSEVPYKQKRVRRFFTLYFIPVIPLDLVAEYVECQHCRGTFQTAVLEFDPDTQAVQFEAEFHHAVKRTMVLMMLADGVVDDGEIEVIRTVYEKLTAVELTDADVQHEIDAAQSDGAGIDAYLAQMAGFLNDQGKEMVVKGAFLVAAADGEFQEEEQQLLVQIGKTLQMSPAHLKGVIDSMAAEAA
jgi:DnaJ-domain-containing protein 1